MHVGFIRDSKLSLGASIQSRDLVEIRLVNISMGLSFFSNKDKFVMLYFS